MSLRLASGSSAPSSSASNSSTSPMVAWVPSMRDGRTASLSHERRQQHPGIRQGPAQAIVARERRIGRADQRNQVLPAEVLWRESACVVLDRLAQRWVLKKRFGASPMTASIRSSFSNAVRIFPSAALRNSDPCDNTTAIRLFSVGAIEATMCWTNA
jgi:hypothetical protein